MRFRNLTDMQTVATTLGMNHEAQLGRFKVTAISDAVGSAGVMEMMASIKWSMKKVLYIGEGHTIVAAKVPGAKQTQAPTSR